MAVETKFINKIEKKLANQLTMTITMNGDTIARSTLHVGHMGDD